MLEFWFDFASTYSYVAAMRIDEACSRAGVAVAYRPFLLGPVFTEQLGIKDSPFNAHPVRGRYMWRDLERLCAKYGLAWKRPSAFPRSSLLAARVACAGEGEPWLALFVRTTFAANFAQDGDIADPQVLAPLLRSAGADADAVLRRAAAPEVKALLRSRTEEAKRIGIFGAPDFVVSGELFFGQDRLDDAIDWATSSRAAR